MRPTILSKGLHQGDSLSSYLFISYAEGLSTLIRKAILEGDFHRFRIAMGGFEISNLLFTDDNLFFSKASS